MAYSPGANNPSLKIGLVDSCVEKDDTRYGTTTTKIKVQVRGEKWVNGKYKTDDISTIRKSYAKKTIRTVYLESRFVVVTGYVPSPLVEGRGAGIGLTFRLTSDMI